jgi:hypothetical protein
MYGRIIAALNTRFARRFTPDGEDYLYREKPDAAPLRVNARGHRLLIDGFYDRTGWLTTGLLFGFFYLVLALWWVAVASFYTFWERIIPWGLVTLMFSALLLAGWFDLWDFPQRAFFSGAVREKSIKDTWFRYVEYRTTWLWLIGFMYFITPKPALSNNDVLTDPITLAILALGYGLTAYVAVLKFRLRGRKLSIAAESCSTITPVA